MQRMKIFIGVQMKKSNDNFDVIFFYSVQINLNHKCYCIIFVLLSLLYLPTYLPTYLHRYPYCIDVKELDREEFLLLTKLFFESGIFLLDISQKGFISIFKRCFVCPSWLFVAFLTYHLVGISIS